MLDGKREKYIFVGYDSSSKGYKLYNPNNGKIISRDVKFNEEVWDWSVQEDEYETLPLNEEKENKQGETYKRLLLHFHHHLHQFMKFQQYHSYWKLKWHHVLEVYKIFMR